MIMATLHIVNHSKLSLTRYKPLRQIKSGAERCGDLADPPYGTAAKPPTSKTPAPGHHHHLASLANYFLLIGRLRTGLIASSAELPTAGRNLESALPI